VGPARPGDVVEVVHACRLQHDGTLVESTTEDNPLRFTVGARDVPAALDEGVVGMRPGDEKRVEANPEHAYGRYRPDRTVVVPRTRLPHAPAVGMRLRVAPQEGEPFDATITHLSADEVVLDTNHPLAGRDVVFDVRLLRIIEREHGI
jgi:FKBP-type peptidyl-prolyl cis-trans isomerase 2